ncbi:MAG: GAF domain-containing protein [Cellulomonas sp.]
MTTDVPGDITLPIARAAGLMLGVDTAEAVLRLLAAAAVHVVPAAWGAGFTSMARDGSPETRVATDDAVLELDGLQYKLREGPCLSSWSERQAMRIDDVASDTRWPRWAPEASSRGLGSSLSAPMVAGDSAVGAIKLYSDRPAAFTAADESTISLLAAQAAVLTAAAQGFEQAGELAEHVSLALRRRDALQRACGMVMGREKISEVAALAHLMAAAARDSCTVHDVAQRMLRPFERVG